MAGNVVIAGTDGSDPSLRAVEWAAREALGSVRLLSARVGSAS